MKKIISILGILTITMATANSANAAVDFNKEYAKYETICEKKSSYKLNKEVCDDFKEYSKAKLGSNITSYKKAVKKDVSTNKMETFIANNEKLKTATKNKKTKLSQQIETINQQIKSIEAKANENDSFLDFIFGQPDNETDDQINKLKLEINSINGEIKVLENELKEINAQIKKQKDINFALTRETIDLYNSKKSSKNGNYNKKLNNVDLSKINDTHKNWLKPVKHATITATTWHYPSDFGGGWHPRTDFAVDTGTKLVAPANGVLLSTSTGANGYGNHIVIAVKKGNYVYTMLFAHLSKFEKNITSFKQGDVIARTGNTGASTGPHLHMEIFRHNTSDLSKVVNEFKDKEDYWFGLTYTKIGNKKKVTRLSPTSFYGLKYNQTY